MKKQVAILTVCALPVVAMAQYTNVLRNSGFEWDPAGESQSYPGWTPYGPTYGPVVHTNAYSESGTGVAHGGVSSLKVLPDLTTYNVNYNGMYQDYLSGPGATCAADGWVYAPSASVLAGGNSAWLEVTFRDANANVLALYRSAIVTNVAGGGFPQDTWVDLPVTNACDPGTLAATGTVSQLVAPAGTYFARYRVVVRGDGSGAGGALYFDDLQLGLSGATPYGAWSVAWSDEFNGTNVDPNTWTYDIGTGDGPGQPGAGWGNYEQEYYTSNADNVYESGGMLHIIAQSVRSGYNGTTADYTSARLKSQGLFSAKYGRIEWRAKLPVGLGCWPALWLLGTNITSIPWPGCGEIDVMENRGSDPTTVQSSTHSGGNGGSDGYGDDGGIYQFVSGQETNAAAGFHTYTLDWSTNAIMFSTDGHLFATVKNWSSSVGSYPFPFNQPFFFIMNLAIGGSYLGYPSDSDINAGTSFPAEMDMDYLRIYELTNPALAPVPQPPPPQPVSPDSVLVDFDSGDANDVTPGPDASGHYWNSALVSQSPNTAVPVNGSTAPMALVNAANASSGISLTITNSGYAASANPSWGDYTGNYGWPAAVNGTNYPATALRDGMTVGGGGYVTVTLSGLNPGSTYTLLTYGATIQSFGSTTTDNGNSQSNTLTVGTSPSPASVRFNAFYNNSTVVVWSNVVPSAAGQIAFTMTEPAGGSGGALNLMAVIPGGELSTNPPAAPTGLQATAGDGQVALTWTGSTGATSYNVKRSTSSGLETNITNVTTVNYTDAGLVNGTTYYYEVSAVNAGGQSGNSAEVSATPQATLASVVAALVDFNSDSPGTDATASPDGSGNYWNNVSASADGHVAFNLNGSYAPISLVGTNNVSPGWTLAVTNLPGGYNYNGGAGSHYYDYAGPYPAAVTNFPATALRDAMAVTVTGVSVTLAGLNTNSAYNLLLYGACSTSTADYGSGGNQTDTLTVGSSGSPAAIDFNSLANATTVVTWTNITPDASGRIAFTVVPDASNGGGDVNLLEVSQVAGSSPPSPARITTSLNGSTLNLTWPSGQGWRLESQTNSLSPGGWQTVGGAADGSYMIVIQRANPAVFYRLVNP